MARVALRVAETDPQNVVMSLEEKMIHRMTDDETATEDVVMIGGAMTGHVRIDRLVVKAGDQTVAMPSNMLPRSRARNSSRVGVRTLGVMKNPWSRCRDLTHLLWTKSS